MKILTPSDWTDYELLDCGDGYRLERFGEFVIARPDPQAIWQPHLHESVWVQAHASFKKSGNSGHWLERVKMPDKWLVRYKNLQLWVKLSPFKHTGVFPEQAIHWNWITDKIQESRVKNQQSEIRILNLFGYTGGASLAGAAAGAKVTHVDASRPAIGWARDNQLASGLIDPSAGGSIRWILDDAVKFVQRELRRGNKYEGIILDPPVFGHSPDGRTWKFNENFPTLLEMCVSLLSDQPLFIIVNAYAISSSALMLENVFKDYLKTGQVEVGELCLQEKDSQRLLSTGIFARWTKTAE